MRRTLIAPVAAACLTVAALSGCGSSTTPDVTIVFKSPAITHTAIPARYTCDGQNIAPPLEWGTVSSNTRELAVFILGLTPKRSGSGYNVSVEWTVAGINPTLHHLTGGSLPPGAHVGRSKGNKKRYSICPARGSNKHYQFALYAVPTSVTVPHGYVGLRLLQLIANPESSNEADAGGAFVASYKRERRSTRHT